LNTRIIQFLKTIGLFGLFESIHESRWHAKAKARGTFSQHGEDLFLQDYFKGRTTGTFLDVGAHHPFIISNTYRLYTLGWRGVILEPIPWLFRKHVKWRPEDTHLNAAAGENPDEITFYELTPSGLSTFDKETVDRQLAHGAYLNKSFPVKVLPLRSVCREHFQGKTIDLFSLDAESFEMPILRGMDWERHRPTLVICEIELPNQAQPRTDITEFLEARDYRLIKRLGCNGVFESTRKP
jgi:FkbM family methyltransferase